MKQAKATQLAVVLGMGSAILGGGGGGKDDFAQGGGLDAGAITKAFTEITKFITEKIK